MLGVPLFGDPLLGDKSIVRSQQFFLPGRVEMHDCRADRLQRLLAATIITPVEACFQLSFLWVG